MDDALRQQIDRVGERYRRLRKSAVLTGIWLVLAVIGLAIGAHARHAGVPTSGWLILTLFGIAVIATVVVNVWPSRANDPQRVARKLEQRFPDLNSRLLTSLEQRPDASTGRLNYLQRRVVDETLEHARYANWSNAVSPRLLAVATWGQRLSLAVLAVVFLGMLGSAGPLNRRSSLVVAGNVSVEPGDTSVERGSSMLVLARFAGPMPADVRLITKSDAGSVETSAMSKSLDDPVFAVRVPRVNADLQYAVQHGGGQTQWFKASVFETPELKQADAELTFPAYTKLPVRREADVRSLTAVEGTTAVVTMKLNKPVAAAELKPANGKPIKLAIDPNKPDEATARIDLKQSQKLTLDLTDADGRHNKSPAAEFALHVNPNRPPELKPVTPGRDVDVSPIQELSTGVRVSDDFGVNRVGVSYGLAGRPATEVTLAADVPGGQKRDVSQLVSLEPIGAKPDELLSYYFWAEDVGPDGKPRRVSSDMFFAEVRPFEEIFRQGQQQSAGEQQQQHQQQGGNGQQAEKLAELQKQIIAATWKIIRRETTAPPTAAFIPDVTLVRDSQSSARTQAEALGERLTDAKSAGLLKNVLEQMGRATAALESTLTANAPGSLTPALASEQAAYQALLRLRAREFEVTQGNQRQQGQSASSASSRRQQQLDQLQLDQEQNRYETQRTASPPADNPQQRETRQVLNRLKELAQRQEDLNRQMEEMKSALDRAKDDTQREEIQRQLARLRDQQAEQLRDTDELRDRMNRPENQESLTDARQQLEQTRENVRRASEALRQNQVPEAATSGARASEQLNNLRDQVRRGAAGELGQAMTDLRQQARDLDTNQQKLSEQLKAVDANSKPSLRDGDERKQLAERLGQQKQNLDQLTESIRKTVESSESSEPLVSKQLYDTLRQAGQQQTDKALEVSRQLLDRGFTGEARQAEAEAGKGVSQLRQGVEQAATGVLGDEAEALRRAKGELDRLADELQREVARQRPRTSNAATAGPATRPTARVATNGPATQPGDATASGTATTRPAQLALGGQKQSDTARSATSRPGEDFAGQPTDGGGRTERPNQQGDATPGNEQSARPGQRGGPNGQPSDRDQPQRPTDLQRNPAHPQGQPGLRGQPGQGNAGGPPSGNDSPDEARPNNGDRPRQPGEAGQPNRQETAGRSGGAGEAGDPNRPNDGVTNAEAEGTDGPLTGGGFRDWSDRLRDVEEMVTDPKLRDRVARVRERARDIRADVKRHSKVPNWDVVQDTVVTPLDELRDRVAQELIRRTSPDALVPLDREGVPPQYAEQVRQYYERLGAGR